MNRICSTLFLLGSLVLLSACGRDKVLDVGPFASYVAKFEARSVQVGQPTKVDDLVMKFGPTNSASEAGYCEIAADDDAPPTITINLDTWLGMDEAKREALAFHELGHCVLRRVHLSGELSVGIPLSVMNPYTLEGNIYEGNLGYYTQELFSHRNEF